MRIEYLEAALSDLDNITDYYFALFGIESAMKVYDQIRASVGQLDEYPGSGVYTDDKVTARNFIRYMVCLGIMKSNDKEIFSVIVNGKSRRVYMIRKTAVDLPGVEKYER